MPTADLVAELTRRGWTVASAESLTGGMVASAIVSVPGASAVMRGGVVAYATDVKAHVLGVDGLLLASGGAVQAQVAREMAHGARRLMDARLGLSTTGVAGPDPQDDQPVGRVFVAVGWLDEQGLEHDEVRMLDLTGDRARIRAAATKSVLELAGQVLRGQP